MGYLRRWAIAYAVRLLEAHGYEIIEPGIRGGCSCEEDASDYYDVTCPVHGFGK